MNQGSKAKIFLADKRGCDETGWFRSYSTFNFGKYFDEHKYRFGDLYVLNDDTVAGGHSVSLAVEEGSYVLLLPVVGTVLCKVNGGNISIVNTGQLQIIKAPEGAEIELLNCYKNELINFIQARVKAGVTGGYDGNQLFTFNLDENKNRLIEITASTAAESGNPVVSIGKFAGRREVTYELKNSRNNLFVFVIEGVFEVQGRLLHARDGLGLWNEAEKIGLEALSNNAIVLIIEMSEI
jgi:quercetin 2,3-dioxygenase